MRAKLRPCLIGHFPHFVFAPYRFTAFRVLQFGQFYNVSDGRIIMYHSHQVALLYVLTFYHFSTSRLGRFLFRRTLPFFAHFPGLPFLPFTFTGARPCFNIFNTSCDPSGINISHHPAPVSFCEFLPHTNLYPKFVGFLAICRVASGRGVACKFHGSNFQIISQRRRPDYRICSASQFYLYSATYTFVGFVDICHVA